MELAQFDYDLPENLVAAVPAERREHSRLLCIEKRTGALNHLERFERITEFLKPGDLLVLNDARVMSAQLDAQRKTGGKVEVLLVSPAAPGAARTIENAALWTALLRSGGTIRPGEKLLLPAHQSEITVEEIFEGGYASIRFAGPDAVRNITNAGKMPLPPYIRRARRRSGMPEHMPELDKERYQTVYACKPGAVAAPTGGLHFTEKLLHDLRRKGVETRSLTLMVGPGTFMPVRTGRVEDHRIAPESYHIPADTASAVKSALEAGRRIVATGTTTVRVLEHLARTGQWREHSGRTGIFIYPPFEFKVTGAMITNFHMPQSTLLMLVSAFAGRENILSAYKEAVERRYRFYSYGDATFLY